MKVTRINPPDLAESSQAGFTQVIIEENENIKTIHISGQVAWDSNRVIKGVGDLYVQVVESLRNLERALKVADLTLEHVSSMRIYIKENHIADTEAVTKALKEVFGENIPCSTWVGVSALAVPDFLVEIEPSPIIIFKNIL